MASPTLADLEAKYFPPGPFLGTPHSADTVVTPHVDGEALFAAIARVLDTCNGPGDRIYICSWWLDPGTTLMLAPGPQKPLGEILLDKAEAGADVRIIATAPRFAVEPGAFQATNLAWWVATVAVLLPLGKSPANNIRAVRQLRAATRGAKAPLEGRVLLDWGGFTDSRHEKSTTIYSASTGELHAFLGGMDYAPHRLSDELHATSWWHDAGVQLQGGAAAAVLANFRTRWAETVTLPGKRYALDGVTELFNPTIEPTAPPAAPSPAVPLPTGVPSGSYLDTSIRVGRSYNVVRATNPWIDVPSIPWDTLPTTGVREILAVLENAIDKATNYIYIEDQTVNPTGTEWSFYVEHKALYPRISSACSRGVKVLFVTQGYSEPTSANLSMSPEIEYFFGPLQLANFALYYVKGTKVHSKLVIIDDEFVSIGSANLWDRSMYGTESELSSAIVHPGSANSLAADLRVRLWRGHLRVQQSATVDAELRDLSSFGLFHAGWGKGVTFAHPDSALVGVTP